MKRSHRRSHLLIWLLLLPALIGFVYYAQVSRVSDTPKNVELEQPSATGTLP